MTEHTLREQIEGLKVGPYQSRIQHGKTWNLAITEVLALLDAQPAPDVVAEADPAGVAAATEIIQWQGKEATACAMIQHIATTLKEKGKGLITTDPASFGQVILEFDAALTAERDALRAIREAASAFMAVCDEPAEHRQPNSYRRTSNALRAALNNLTPPDETAV